MKALLHWLDTHPNWNWAVVLIVSMLYFALHDLAQQPFYWFTAAQSYELLHVILNVFFAVIFLVLSFYFYKKIKQHPRRKHLLLYFIPLVIACILCYLFIMPYKSEGVHFIQYGLLGILCYPVFRNKFNSLCLAIIIGMIDEHVQYIITKRLYLDFNDIVLNCLAVSMGVMVAYMMYTEQESMDRKSPIGNSPYIVLALWSIFVLLSISFGWITYFTDEPSSTGWHYFRFDSATFTPVFWYEVPWGIWHQVRPIAGAIFVLIFPLLFRSLHQSQKT